MADPIALASLPSVATLVRVGIWAYSAVALAGALLGIVALVDGGLNLLAVRGSGNGRQGAAWLWLGVAATAFIAQAKLAVLGLVIVARPPRPLPPDQLRGDVLLVSVFLAGGLLVLAIQIATIAGRSALRHRPPVTPRKEAAR